MKLVDIKLLKPWVDNPRNVSDEGLARLRAQIEELGLYKPLIVMQDLDGYIVLGGNQRLKVLSQMGYSEVEVEVVEPKSEVEKIEIAIASNDLSGEYAMDLLLNALRKADMVTGLENYHVNFAPTLSADCVFMDQETFFEDSSDYIQKKVIIVPGDVFSSMIEELEKSGVELGTANFSETILKLIELYEART